MTHSKIYNQLAKAGIIKNLMIETNQDEEGIMKGIKYLEDFVGTNTFNSMNYLLSKNIDKTVSSVCLRYLNLQIINKTKELKKLYYMEDMIGHIVLSENKN